MSLKSLHAFNFIFLDTSYVVCSALKSIFIFISEIIVLFISDLFKVTWLVH